MQSLIVKRTWFVCLLILAVGVVADHWNAALLLGVALICVLRSVAFAIEEN